ncbi:hypothetical protein [Luteimonas notoginsengisoli]|uniref:Uncharacterized protein n=1 Tax=Luteimonas notoginsengisoli TaxID=1578200 RepID=A0ABV7USK4_9GAMM
MNRKLHNSMLGLGATGLVLVFALMAATPVLPGQDAPAPLGFAASAPAAGAGPVAMQADIDAIEARARQFESELEDSASLGDTIASAMSFAAAVSTEAALSAAFEATADEAEHKRAAAKEKRRHARQVRGALAVPYFSFAQGLRRGSRS